MAVTNYKSPVFYIGVNDEGEYFANRRADPSRDVYHYIHTPDPSEAEVFCEHCAGFLEEHGYSRLVVNAEEYQHKHWYPYYAAKRLDRTST